MKAKELIKTLQELDQGEDLSVFFCAGSIYKDGLTNIGNVIAEDGKFIVITNVGKWGVN